MMESFFDSEIEIFYSYEIIRSLSNLRQTIVDYDYNNKRIE